MEFTEVETFNKNFIFPVVDVEYNPAWIYKKM